MTDRTDRFYGGVAAALDAYLAVTPAQVEALGRSFTSYAGVPPDVHQVLARVASALAIDPQCFYEVVWQRAQDFRAKLQRALREIDEIADSERGILAWRPEDTDAGAAYDRDLIDALLARIARARFSVNAASETVDTAAVADASAAALDLARLTARPSTPPAIRDGVDRARRIIDLLQEADLARAAFAAVDGEVQSVDPRTVALTWALDVADARVRTWLLPENQENPRDLAELAAEMITLHGVLEMLQIQPAATGLLVHPQAKLEILRDGIFMEVEGVATAPLLGAKPGKFDVVTASGGQMTLAPATVPDSAEASWFVSTCQVLPHRDLAVFADVTTVGAWEFSLTGTPVRAHASRPQPRNVTFSESGGQWTAVASSAWTSGLASFYVVVEDLNLIVVIDLATGDVTATYDPLTGSISAAGVAALQVGTFSTHVFGASDVVTGHPEVYISVLEGLSFGGRVPAEIERFNGSPVTMTVTLPNGETAGPNWALPADPRTGPWAVSAPGGSYPDGWTFPLPTTTATVDTGGRTVRVTLRGWENISPTLALGLQVFWDEYGPGARVLSLLRSTGRTFLVSEVVPSWVERLHISRGGDGYVVTAQGNADICANDLLVFNSSPVDGTSRVINAVGPEITVVPARGPIDGEPLACARFRHIAPGDLLAWARPDGTVTGRGRIASFSEAGTLTIDVLDGSLEDEDQEVIVWFYATPQTSDYVMYRETPSGRRRVGIAEIEDQLRQTFSEAAARRGLAPSWSVTSAGQLFPHEVLRDDRIRIRNRPSLPGQSVPLQLRFNLGAASDTAILTALEEPTTSAGDPVERSTTPLASCQITQVLPEPDQVQVGSRVTFTGPDPVPAVDSPVVATVRSPRPGTTQGPVTFGGHSLYPFFAFAQYRAARAENPVEAAELEQDAIAASVDRGATSTPLGTSGPATLAAVSSRRQLTISTVDDASIFPGAELVLSTVQSRTFRARIRAASVPAGAVGLVTLEMAADIPSPDATSGLDGVDLAALLEDETELVFETTTLTALWREVQVARAWVTECLGWIAAVRPPRTSYFTDASTELVSRGRVEIAQSVAKADVRAVLNPFRRQAGDFERSVADRLQSVVESLQSARVSPLSTDE